jgi:hypothetical protein
MTMSSSGSMSLGRDGRMSAGSASGVHRGGAEPGSRARASADAAIEALFGTDGPPDFDDLAGPLYWWQIPASETAQAWEELRAWVEQLLKRFPHLDHHAVPVCWWRHNGHVEALAALRDHERTCYSDTSPPTAGVEWHRAFRDIEIRLREWTSTLACGSVHDPRSRPAPPTDTAAWDDFVADDTRRRAESQLRPNEEQHTDGTQAGDEAREPAP